MRTITNTKTVKKYINIYKDPIEYDTYYVSLFDTKEDSETRKGLNYIKTIEIDIEE